MRAITVEPMKGLAQLEDVPEPDVRDGSVLAEGVSVGVCGTDVEIAEGKYGGAAPGKTRLVLGHESLGCVVDPGPTSGLNKGDLVVGIVRRPDPVPCPNCAVGEWDMCRNGQYTERGIKQIDGFMSERWRTEPEYAIKVDRRLRSLGVLLEPTTVVTKAWEHILAVGGRASGSRGPSSLPVQGRSVSSAHWSECSSGWRFTSSIETSRDPSPASCALSARPTTQAELRTLGSRRTLSWSVPVLGRSSRSRFRSLARVASYALQGSGTISGGRRSRQLSSPHVRCSRTIS